MTPSKLFHRFVHWAASSIEADVDRLHGFLAGDTRGQKVRMLAYAGYRNATELRVCGRIVRYFEPLAPGETTLSRAKAMLSIYNSHEVGGVQVRCDAFGNQADAWSDGEGYFRFALAISRRLPSSTTWEAATLFTPGREMQAPSIDVPILAPGTDDHWAVISDIDDTVIETGSTNFLKNWRRVLAERPRDRQVVPGAVNLYALIAVNHAAPTRPFFYVSSSPWNLYGFLTEFMELNRIPHGPMFLKDLGVDSEKLFHSAHETHKLDAIRTVLDFYPGHRFLLIGDNGQKDVEIYSEAVAAHPGRVGAVFIRDVTGTCAEGPRSELLAKIANAGVPTYCAATFEEGLGVLQALGFERSAEVAKAAGQQSDANTESGLEPAGQP